MREWEWERERFKKKGEKDESEPATFSTPDRCDGARRGVEDRRAKGEIVSPRPSLVDFSFDLRRLRTRRQPRRSFDPWWKDREETKRNSLLEREKERVLIGRMDNRLLWRWSCNLILYIGYILYIVKSLCDINGYVFTIKKKKGKKKRMRRKMRGGGLRGEGGM